MLYLLIIGICFASIIQSCDKRREIALWVASAIVIHELLFGALGGLGYYFTDAVFSLLVIMRLEKIKIQSRMVSRLIIICVSSIIINFYGWIIWSLYLPPDTYNLLFLLLYSAVIAIMLREESDAGNITDNRWILGFCGSSRQGHNGCYII